MCVCKTKQETKIHTLMWHGKVAGYQEKGNI